MTVDEAQRDLRRAYVGGGPGVFAILLTIRARRMD